MYFNTASFDAIPSSTQSNFTFTRPFAPNSSVMAGSRSGQSLPHSRSFTSTFAPRSSYSSLPSSGTSSPTLPISLRPTLAIAPSQYQLPTPPRSSAPEHNFEKKPTTLTPPSPRTIFHQLTHFLQPHKPYPPQLEIPFVSPTTFNDFLTRYSESTLLNHTKLDYDAPNHRIILCAPPTPYHDCMPSFLQETLTALRSTQFDTPARQRTLRVTQVSWRAPDGSYLVPDAAISVMGAQPRLWPPLVVEVANTQTYESATAKVARWFTTSEGSVEVALLMKFTAPDAMVDPACFVEVWRSRPGSELVGDVEDPESPGGDGASAVGTSSDDEETTVDLALGTDQHPDAAYGPSSSARTIYRDGPRRIVYPAVEPPAVQTPISLRYSDFFGTENVPAGRDPGEVVFLDLEVLREVLVEFVDLTRAQVASIKRKREGEDEAVVEVSMEEVADEKDEVVQQNRAGGKRVRR